MRIPAQRDRSGLQVNITPLIDVVFLLIIFFLVASHFIRSETREPIELPTAKQGRDDEAKHPRRLVITVNAEEQLFVGGKSVSTEDVRSMIMSGRAEHGIAFELRIRGDKQAAFRAVRPIIEWCAKSGITKLKFAVQGDL
ncbi:MAG: biopolymer transporter ExbD [Planctomycetota bacterium]|nr:biopolymer transporter ExbD [Planctomycetota bacterium]